MASCSEEDPCCAVCHDIYTDPVAKRQSRRSACKLHSEELKLFCTEHQEPVCLVCRDSEKHIGHKFRPIDEAAPVFRSKLEEDLQIIKEKLLSLNESKDRFSAAEVHVKTQVRHTERQIRRQFKKFHEFLEEQEEERIRALKEEGRQKRQSFKDKMADLSEEIEVLSKIIATKEEQLKATNVFFLLEYKSEKERLQECPLLDDLQVEPGSLVDQVKHLGNLAFNIWTNMKDLVQFHPVVLDPNTAHPELALSEDLTGLSFREGQKLPENPERFEMYRWVLGSEGVTSGSHSWDVEVAGDGWAVGVVSESVERKTPVNSGVWKIFLYHGKYFAFSPPDPLIPLSVKKKLQRVRVNVDFNGGIVSFFDANSTKQLHVFLHTLDETVFPYFETFSDEQLNILPIQFSSIVFNPSV
uniref:Uncharacterized protein n=1 Tax=Neogobius melanostomus TaxID=47308 RepID=A0A8C6U997_9GOBI